jgi:peptidoglycan/xylan/chitin deacetylase (PgdA/CDA1 family)
MPDLYGHPDATGHEVILSFDDGPHPKYTPMLLDLLAKENLKALFFVCGQNVAARGGRDIVKRAATEGHLVGNHSYSHAQLTKLTADQVRSEISRTHDLIAEFEPLQKLCRPPYGAHNKMVDDILQELGYRVVLWNVDPEDWKSANKPEKWIDVAMDQISHRAHTIFLCHDIQQTTVENFPALLTRIRALPNPAFTKYA